MLPLSILIIKIGLGITFILTGCLILKDEDKWVHMLPGWFKKYVNPRKFMISTACIDIIAGILLFSGIYPLLVSSFAVLHLIGVLIVSGRDEFHEVYRDLGLVFMGLALIVYYL